MSTTTHTAEEIRTATIDNLDHLIAVCKDGEAGFRAATDDTDDLDLKEVFTRLARQRAAVVWRDSTRFCRTVTSRIRCRGADS